MHDLIADCRRANREQAHLWDQKQGTLGLAGGGTNYGLSDGLGGGHSDMFHAAVHSTTRINAASPAATTESIIRPAVEVERLVVGVTYDVPAPAPPPISSVGVGVCRTCINPRSRHSAEAHEFSNGPASDEHRPPRCARRV
jgi:hypothetical protein